MLLLGPTDWLVLPCSPFQNTVSRRPSLGRAVQPSLAGTMTLRRTPVTASSMAGAGATKTVTSPRKHACSTALASPLTPALHHGSPEALLLSLSLK